MGSDGGQTINTNVVTRMGPWIGDAFGLILRASASSLKTNHTITSIIERDDGLVQLEDSSVYFSTYEEWPKLQQMACDNSMGRVLDIGCGAGRHALHLQRQGVDVTGLDKSKGAVEVCREVGLRNAVHMSVYEYVVLGGEAFETILLLGNNAGLLGGRDHAFAFLSILEHLAGAGTKIYAEAVDPYQAKDSSISKYAEANVKRGRMAGQWTIRVRYMDCASEWFDFLFLSVEEMERIVHPTKWMLSGVEQWGAAYLATLQLRG